MAKHRHNLKKRDISIERLRVSLSKVDWTETRSRKKTQRIFLQIHLVYCCSLAERVANAHWYRYCESRLPLDFPSLMILLALVLLRRWSSSAAGYLQPERCGQLIAYLKSCKKLCAHQWFVGNKLSFMVLVTVVSTNGGLHNLPLAWKRLWRFSLYCLVVYDVNMTSL